MLKAGEGVMFFFIDGIAAQKKAVIVVEMSTQGFWHLFLSPGIGNYFNCLHSMHIIDLPLSVKNMTATRHMRAASEHFESCCFLLYLCACVTPDLRSNLTKCVLVISWQEKTALA